ncbi:hypothetical protein K0M31_003406 [Melipona bicolor]|uniref:Uncharacterized protein n=1 Tax=Melipona bicolor TaxID=60889 RepID=A0AA40FYV2_9HYME|nr:hypothetical protein K0M31_003406 [Melipona bicolor]
MDNKRAERRRHEESEPRGTGPSDKSCFLVGGLPRELSLIARVDRGLNDIRAVSPF